MLRVTFVVVTLATTVVPAATPVPLTDVPALIPLVAEDPTSVNVTPDRMLTVGEAVTAEFPELKVIVSVVVTPPPDNPGGDSVTVVVVVGAGDAETVVPPAIFVPPTGIPGAIPSPVPANVSVDPEAALTGAVNEAYHVTLS